MEVIIGVIIATFLYALVLFVAFQDARPFRTIHHYCSITQEAIQEYVRKKDYTYVCGACSEALLLSNGKVINMDWKQIGEWVEGKGEYRRISTGKVLRFVGKHRRD